MGEGIASVPAADRRAVLRAAALWLAFLAPLFYLTYGTANWLASLRAEVPDIAFGWERHIPFIAWTIVPYWSINAFYALSLLVNDTPEEVGRLVIAAARWAEAQGFSEDGYRIVINCNRDGGQTVYHLHLHLLAGRVMRWPPG